MEAIQILRKEELPHARNHSYVPERPAKAYPEEEEAVDPTVEEGSSAVIITLPQRNVAES